MVSKLVIEKTPIEEYKVNNLTVYVKREDLSSPFPGPNISKVRGFLLHLLKIKERGYKNVGIVDSLHSRSGWAVSYICSQIKDLTCYEFFPQRKDIKLGFNQLMCKHFNARLVPQVNARYSIRYARAKKFMQEIENSYMIPYLNIVQENTNETARITREVFEEYNFSTVVVSVGSGATMAGIIKGLSYLNKTNTEVLGILADKNVTKESRLRNIRKLLEIQNFARLPHIRLINYGFEYNNPEFYPCPFPCDLYYDRKAWRFLCENIHKLRQPILFWNLGGEWDPVYGLSDNLRGDGLTTKQQIKEFLNS